MLWVARCGLAGPPYLLTRPQEKESNNLLRGVATRVRMRDSSEQWVGVAGQAMATHQTGTPSAPRPCAPVHCPTLCGGDVFCLQLPKHAAHEEMPKPPPEHPRGPSPGCAAGSEKRSCDHPEDTCLRTLRPGLTILEGPAHSCLLQRLLGAQPVGLLQCSFGSRKVPQVLQDLQREGE